MPEDVIVAMSDVLRGGVSNLGGGFASSEVAELATTAARRAMARMLGTEPDRVSFGQNMTSLTFAMSRSIASTWREGDAIVLTSLDHDANYTPWVMAARDAGVQVRVADFDAATGLLGPEALMALIDEDVRLVALGLASNALGSVVDVARVADAAHGVGALVYVDAVHAAPHRRIDVEALGCDFLAVSSYKFFGPHTGILYGRPGPMSRLDAYKVRPAPSDPPGKWETGTQSFESLAGVAAAVGYLESLGDGSLDTAFAAIEEHETTLGRRFLDGLDRMRHVTLFGPPHTGPDRVSTFALEVSGVRPDHVARRMADAGVWVWAGHHYAINVMNRLGKLDSGGLVRIGFVHYNTIEEVDRALEVLADLA